MFGPRGAGASRCSDDLHNEDTFLIADELGLYAVCDGHGAEPAGEVAAYLAAEAVRHYLEEALRDVRDEADPASPSPRSADSLSPISDRTIEAAIRNALECILDAVEDRQDLEGMATTVTLLLIQRGRAFVGHLGDSRAYLVRGDDIVQLTTDTEWSPVGAPRSGPSSAPVQSFSLPTMIGDTFILCTDGAETQVTDPELAVAIGTCSPRLLASRIVGAAHRKDPTQDATAVVVRIREGSEPSWALEADAGRLDELRDVLAPRSAARRSKRPYDFDRAFSEPDPLIESDSPRSASRRRSRTPSD